MSAEWGKSESQWARDQLPVQAIARRVALDEVDRESWPGNIPAVWQFLEDGLVLPTGVTFLVGENGSGKSTLVEAIASAYGLGVEGGTPNTRHASRESESPLADWIRISRGPSAPRWGFFLRAETMHGFYSYQETVGERVDYHAMSHGESFLTLLNEKIDAPGFYCMDEPEAALSFTSQLAFVAGMRDLANVGAQILCATHSPILASLPGARILELGEWGMRETRWDDLEIVGHWREFLADPDIYLRYLEQR